MTFRIRPACDAEADAVMELLEKAAAWVAEQGSDQWQNVPGRSVWVQRDIDEGGLHVVDEEGGRGAPVATITVDRLADADFWRPGDKPRTAVYVHRMAVSRDLSGQLIGSAMLDWAGRYAQARGLPWVRLDAWRTNERLQRYYLGQGFQHVRTCDLPHRGSGALFQRPATLQLGRGPHIRSDRARQ